MPPETVTRCACGCEAVLSGGQKRWSSPACRDRARAGDRHAKPRPDRHKNRVGKRAAAKPFMVAGVDGESIDGRYVLMAWATDDDEGEVIARWNGLSSRDCLNFLCDIPAGIKVWGFAFGYDVNMLLVDVPVSIVTRLYEQGVCFWHGFRIKYVPGKMLQVSRYRGRGEGKVRTGGVTVWDMFTWVQTSFVRWLEDWQLAPAAEIERILDMKQQRSTFDDSQHRAIERYCVAECRYLAAGGRRLIQLVRDAGVKGVQTWYSPATISKAMLRREDTMQYRAEPPDAITSAVDAAYHGGRAEVAVIGPLDHPVWQYDIRSAYPSAAVDLPCLACGRWTHNPTGKITPYSLVRVSWRPKKGDSEPTWGPYPVTPRTGSKRWPTHGTGWYWGVEVLAGMRHSTVTVKDMWTFRPRCEHQPFAYMRALYDERVQRKADGDPTELVLKLALNATYGALAEHPHRNEQGEWVESKYRCLVWAGLMTAATRAKLLDALSPDVVFLAVDSLVSTTELDLPIGTDLGEWEVKRYDGMFSGGTGIYFGHVQGEWTTTKTRGFESGQLTRELLTEKWDADGRYAEVGFERQRFIGMGTALHRVNGFYPPHLRLWRQFVTEKVGKSLDVEPRRAWCSENPHDGRCRAPSLAMSRKAERADRERLERLRAKHDELRLEIERCEAALASGKYDPLGRSAKRDRGRAFYRSLTEIRLQQATKNILLVSSSLRHQERGDESAVFSWADDPAVG